MEHLKAKKSFGQNFLIDNNIARKIVASLELIDSDNIIEIGPGEGALTELILKYSANTIAIDADVRAVELLKKKFPESIYTNLNVLNMDFLEYEFPEKDNLKIIGNIPYNITSPIIFKLLENSNLINSAILTIQKEVADRLVASIRTKDYGILSVAVQLLANVKILFNISPECFRPIPKVWSSVVKFDFKNEHSELQLFKKLMPFVRAAFSQRRKKLSNALNSYLLTNIGNKKIEFINFASLNNCNYFDKRAEELTVDDFKKLYATLCKYKENEK